MSAHSLSIAETDLSFVTHDLQPVALDHLVRLLQTELCHVFESVQVELIQECPDLSVPPFDLATKGLGSGQCLALDIGGVPNLVPVPQLQKPDYAITAICDQLQPMLPYDQLLVIGAAAGPFRETGTCCELIPNVKLVRSPRTPNSDSGDQAKQSRWTVTDNRTHCARLIPNRKAKSRDDVPLIPNLLRMKTDHFTLLGNLFVSDGHQGPVIQIKARKRLIEKDASINGSRII